MVTFQTTSIRSRWVSCLQIWFAGSHGLDPVIGACGDTDGASPFLCVLSPSPLMPFSCSSLRRAAAALLGALICFTSLVGCDGAFIGDREGGYRVSEAIEVHLAASSSLKVNGFEVAAGSSKTITGSFMRSDYLNDTFEGLPVKRSVVTLELSYASPGEIVGRRSVRKDYFDGIFNPRGYYDDGLASGVSDYAVVRNLSMLPTAPRGGESGTWFELTHFESGARKVVTGLTTVSYAFAVAVAGSPGALTITMATMDGSQAPVSTITSIYEIALTPSGYSSIAPARLLKQVKVLSDGSRTELTYS
ncbi:hypothetical protein ACS5PN_00070 [Roseateles sp. NT4]|uniref:hypothetical protein n=1 Tax=Roseateles sp. NT4 TaxID=3453715 RepID=UPI003EEE9401